MTNPTVKIRELKRRDRKVLAAMIRKMVDKVGDKSILNLMVSDSGAVAESPEKQSKDQFSKIGIEVVKLLLDTLENEMAAWFADLLGVTVEEFDDLPFDVELVIIDQLMECEESNRFFTSASRLSSRMKGLAGRFQQPSAK